jgi:iron complex outermembrane receptor protein
VPLGAGTALRVSVLNQTRTDWVNNTYAAGPTRSFEGYRDSAVRAQLLVEASKELSVLANVHVRDFKGSARMFRANIIQPGTNNLVPSFDVANVSQDGKNESKLNNFGANLRIKVDLGSLALYSITGFEQVHTLSRGDIDGGTPTGPGTIPFSSETADGIPKHSQFTQELRVESTAAGPFSWQAGAFLFAEDYKIESFTYDSAAGNTQIGYERVRQQNDAYALFGAVKYVLTSDLSVRGGLRYTQDKKKFGVQEYNSSDFVPCIGPQLGFVPGPPKCTISQLAAQGPLSAAPRDTKLSWDASVSYTLSKDTNLYARVGTGFRGSSVQGAGAFNNQSVATPENNTSVEAGIKADLFNKRARANFTVFSYEVKDLQLTAVGGGANSNILLNAKKATGQGFELDLQAFVTDNLLATFGLGYNKTQIKDPGLAVSVCAQCTVTNPKTAGGQALIDGNPLPQAPKVTASFTLKYSQPVGNGAEVYAFTDWVYRDKVNFFLYQSTEFTGKALTEGGLRVGYTWANGKYDVAAYGRNITNQIRIVGGIDFNNLTGFVNDPRTLGVQFKASF